ncbi:hypothetical protein DdX_05999 [Ditylenchus destructor]|uniref:Uncharacterized protein n=1 Tax=Ditylenchus destructor TaxID=166010 RepID=A0AAD4R9E1_9BILA|nr:hypothetical protein DdX_05999 [Ditylenchus destructor]
MSAAFQAVTDFPALPEERQRCVHNSNKIWFFGQKFHDMPSFNYGQFGAYGGAHSTFFDTVSGTFDPAGPRPFPAISNEENVAEMIFAFQSRIYLLLYVHFGAFRVASLHSFNEDSGVWEAFADIQTSSNDEIPHGEGNYKQNLILVDGDSEDGVYFVSFVDHQIRVHLLKISTGERTAKWEIVGNLPDELNMLRIQPTMAVIQDQNIFIQGGVHGCGFRYQPLALFQFNISDKSANFKEIASEDDKPSFAFSGAQAHAIFPDQGTWVHIAGKNASGMTGSVFNGQIWFIRDLTTENPKWEKQTLEVPDPKGSDLYVSVQRQKRNIFIFSQSLGVLNATV